MTTELETVILLTASINPLSDTPDVGVRDPKVRESQYLLALKHYIGLGLPVVFVDSSNTISKQIIEEGNKIKYFEYHTFSSLHSYLGKGHGEKEILDYAFKNSELILNSKRIIKITGRYSIDNLFDIIQGVRYSNADVHVNFGLNCKRCDSRIIIFSPKFYKYYFKPSLEKYLDESSKIFFEHVLSRSVHLLMAEGGIYEPWPIYPFYRGVNGANSKTVEFNLIKKLKYSLFYQIKLWFLKQIV